MRRLAIKIAYDGSSFYGWQSQIITPTVQQTLEEAFSRIAKSEIRIHGSGRTDTGVHALAQIAHFDFPISMTKHQIILASKSVLPKTLQILNVTEVNKDFNSRYDACERTYKYVITKTQTPFNYKYKSYFPKLKINVDVFKKCIKYFIGEYDYTSFAKPNPDIKNYICNVKKMEIYTENNDIIIFITANRFLHNMVRRIVGAMLSISDKGLDPSIISTWIEARKHEQKNYFTALPNGLYLIDVKYPENMISFSEDLDIYIE